MKNDYTIADYARDVRALFEGGGATDEQWKAMTTILNNASEGSEHDPDDLICPIDDTILGKRIECVCGSMFRPKLPCWGCDGTMVPPSTEER